MADISKMFNAYSEHLKLVRELKITERVDEYICPICLRGYKKSEIDQLSLEDVPQAALEGKKIAITCKKCNNTCGNSIDTHLVNHIDSMEQELFLPGSNRKITIENSGEGKPISAPLKVNGMNDMELFVHENYFNSPYHRENLEKLKENTMITFQNKKKKLDNRLISLAVIKNAYLMLFSKFGYTFLLDDYYNSLRSNLQNFHSKFTPTGIWIMQKNLPIEDGIYLSGNNNYRGFFVAYTVSKIQSYRIIVYIPTPYVKFNSAATAIRNAENYGGLDLIEYDYSNLLWDKNKIKFLHNWVYSKA